MQPDAYSYHQLIAMYCRNKRVKQAAETMREMKLKGLTPAPETYGEIVLALARVGEVDTALAVMTEIKQKNLPMPKERYLRPLRMQLNVMMRRGCDL